MKNIKLLIVGDTYQIHVRRWAEHFGLNGFDVSIISTSGKIHPVKACKIIDISEHNACLQPFIIRKLIKKINPDILHAHSISRKSWFAALCNFHPFVLTAWGSDIFVDAHKNLLYKILAKYTIRKADLITANSHELKNAVIRMGAKPSKCHRILWGVDAKIFNKHTNTLAEKKRFGLDGKIVMFSGRHLFHKYNITTIVKAMPLIVEKYKNVVLIVAGGADPQYEKLIRQTARELMVESNIRYVGLLLPEQMALYYNLSDIFISVPSSDSAAISITEAMSCGCIPIVSDLKAVRELIEDKISGRLIPVDDHRALAHAVIDMLSNQKLAQAIRERNELSAKNNFDQKHWMEKMKELYLGLCNERK